MFDPTRHNYLQNNLTRPGPARPARPDTRIDPTRGHLSNDMGMGIAYCM